MAQVGAMRQKQKYSSLTRDQALDIVRGYHVRGETQQALADRHDTNTGYVSRLVNGEARPDVYEQVSREEAATPPASPGTSA